VLTSTLERWSLPTHFGVQYADRLRSSPRVRLVTGVTCTEIVAQPGGVERLACKTLEGRPLEVRAKRYVIACGGLETTRLLLASPMGRCIAPEALRGPMTGGRVPGVPYGGVEPSPVADHVRNLIRDAGATARFALAFGTRRFLARERRVPGFAVYSPENIYPL